MRGIGRYAAYTRIASRYSPPIPLDDRDMRRLYGVWFVKEHHGNSMQVATESLLLVGIHGLPPTIPSDGGFLQLKAPLRSGRLLFFRARMTVAGEEITAQA